MWNTPWDKTEHIKTPSHQDCPPPLLIKNLISCCPRQISYPVFKKSFTFTVLFHEPCNQILNPFCVELCFGAFCLNRIYCIGSKSWFIWYFSDCTSVSRLAISSFSFCGFFDWEKQWKEGFCVGRYIIWKVHKLPSQFMNLQKLVISSSSNLVTLGTTSWCHWTKGENNASNNMYFYQHPRGHCRIMKGYLMHITRRWRGFLVVFNLFTIQFLIST